MGEGWTGQPQSEGGLLGVVLGGGQVTVMGVETTQTDVRGLSCCYANKIQEATLFLSMP